MAQDSPIEQASTSGGPRKKPAVGLLAIAIVAALLIGFYLAADKHRLDGELVTYVPDGTDAFVHAVRLGDAIHSLTSSDGWKGLQQADRIGRIQRTSIYKLLHDRWQILNAAAPFELSLNNLLNGAGNDAGLAVRINAQTGEPALLGLVRSDLALASPSWFSSFVNAEEKDYAGHTVVHMASEGVNVYVTALGDLVLVSTDFQYLCDTVDLCTGKSTSGFAASVGNLKDKAPSDQPRVDVLINMAETLRKGLPQNEDGDSSALLGALHRRLAELSAPPELLGLVTVFFSNKVETLERTGFVKIRITTDNGLQATLLATAESSQPETEVDDFSIHRVLPADIGYTSVELIEFRGWFNDLIAEEIDDPKVVEAELNAFTAFLGIKDFESEFLDLFGPEVSLIFSPQLPVGEVWKYPLPAAAAAIQVKDPQRVSKFLAKAFDQVMGDMHTDHAAQQEQLADDQRKPFPFEGESITRGDATFTRVRMHENYLGEALSPAFGVIGNFLYISSSHRLLEGVIDATRDNDPLAEQPPFKAVEARLRKPQSGHWFIAPYHMTNAFIPLAFSYINTHQEWSKIEKAGHIQRLRDASAIGAIFESIAFATSSKDGIREVHLVTEFSKPKRRPEPE